MSTRTETIIEIFKEICTIPRESKNEKGIAEWLSRWATDNGFTATVDSVHNVVIRVPGNRCSAGCEGSYQESL